MQAVIRRGQTLVCEAVADLVPQTGQTLVKTLCCGICGSDLHALPYLDLMVESGARSGGASRSARPVSRTSVFPSRVNTLISAGVA